METKLKSNLKQIHWSLVIKATVTGLAWLFLPWGIAAALAAVFYFFPPFRAALFGGHFIAFLSVSWFFHPVGGFFLALILSATFFMMLGIKDMLFITRKDLMPILTWTLVFFLLGGAARHADALALWSGGIMGTALTHGALFLLLLGFFRFRFPAFPLTQCVAFSGLVSLLSFELSLGLQFLAIGPWVRVGALFFFVFIIAEWVHAHFRGRLSREAILRSVFIFSAVMVFVLGLTEWMP